MTTTHPIGAGRFSTEPKTACGTAPDPGSTPGGSTTCDWDDAVHAAIPSESYETFHRYARAERIAARLAASGVTAAEARRLPPAQRRIIGGVAGAPKPSPATLGVAVLLLEGPPVNGSDQ